MSAPSITTLVVLVFVIPPPEILYLTIFHSTDHFFLQLFRPTRIISIESQSKKIVVVVVVVIGVVVFVVVHVVVDPRIPPLKFG